MQPNYTDNNRTLVKIIAGIAILAVAGLAFWKFESKDSQVQPGTQTQDQTGAMIVETTTTTSTTTSSTTPSVNQKYKDGTYSATGSYSSPAGTDSEDITITLKGDVVTDATFKGNAKDPASKYNQQLFADGFKALVVGKNIDSINLTVVNGSSLTPKGFMDALAKIKAQAKI